MLYDFTGKGKKDVFLMLFFVVFCCFFVVSRAICICGYEMDGKSLLILF